MYNVSHPERWQRGKCSGLLIRDRVTAVRRFKSYTLRHQIKNRHFCRFKFFYKFMFNKHILIVRDEPKQK